MISALCVLCCSQTSFLSRLPHCWNCATILQLNSLALHRQFAASSLNLFLETFSYHLALYPTRIKPHEDQTPHPISFLSKNSPRSEPARHLYEFTLFYSTFGCQTYSLCILEHTYSIPPMLKLVLLPNGGCT